MLITSPQRTVSQLLELSYKTSLFSSALFPAAASGHFQNQIAERPLPLVSALHFNFIFNTNTSVRATACSCYRLPSRWSQKFNVCVLFNLLSPDARSLLLGQRRRQTEQLFSTFYFLSENGSNVYITVVGHRKWLMTMSHLVSELSLMTAINMRLSFHFQFPHSGSSRLVQFKRVYN